jgi:cbb3-type cytochrome oxidase subunit 3
VSDSGGDTPSGGDGANQRMVRRVITYLWLAILGVQFVIWLLMCLIAGRFFGPFWLWTLGIGGIVIGVAWWMSDPSRRTRDASEQERSE